MTRRSVVHFFIMGCLLFTGGGSFVLAAETHGTEAFVVGGAAHVFDKLEYEKILNVSQTSAYLEKLKPQLTALAARLPQTASALEYALANNIRPRWYLVSYTLRDSKDAGPTNLVLTFEQKQIALNDGHKVQILESAWTVMDDEQRAFLLLHEALWHLALSAASGPALQGGNIRDLTALLVNPFIEQVTNQELAEDALALLEQSESRLKALLNGDRGGVGVAVPGWHEVSIRHGLHTPAPCSEEGVDCAFKDNLTQVTWAPSFSTATEGLKTFAEARAFCEGLKDYADHSDWRLPSRWEAMKADETQRGNGLGLDLNAFGEIYRTYPKFGLNDRLFWLDALSDKDPALALGINYVSGERRFVHQGARLPVRCVRDDVQHLWRVLPNDTGSDCAFSNANCKFFDEKEKRYWLLIKQNTVCPPHWRAVDPYTETDTVMRAIADGLGVFLRSLSREYDGRPTRVRTNYSESFSTQHCRDRTDENEHLYQYQLVNLLAGETLHVQYALDGCQVRRLGVEVPLPPIEDLLLCLQSENGSQP